MYCEKCGCELQPGQPCTNCGDVSENIIESNEIDPEVAFEEVKPKKTKKTFIIGIISTAVVFIAAAVAAFVIFFPHGNKTFDAVPEDIPGWFEGKDEFDLLNTVWEYVSEPEITYQETTDSSIEKFEFSSTGLVIVGFCDADSHKIMDLMVLTQMASTSANFSSMLDYSESALILLGQVMDEQIIAECFMQLFEVSEDEADEMLEKSKDDFNYEYNGTKYYIEGRKWDDDMFVTITTKKDSDEWLEYMQSITKS